MSGVWRWISDWIGDGLPAWIWIPSLLLGVLIGHIVYGAFIQKPWQRVLNRIFGIDQ